MHVARHVQDHVSIYVVVIVRLFVFTGNSVNQLMRFVLN